MRCFGFTTWAVCRHACPFGSFFTLTFSGLEKEAEGYMGLAEKWFVFAMVWSVMAAADEMGRVKLDSFLRDVEVREQNRKNHAQQHSQGG